MSSEPSPPDFLDRARRASVAGMIAAAVAMALGSALDWVAVVRLPNVLPETELARAGSVTGIGTGDGWWVILGAVIIVNAALLLWIRRSSAWAWLGFFSSVIAGSIAVADYRAISASGSPFLQELDVVGEIDHGIGLLLVLAGALLGVVFALVGVAATPSRR